MTTKEVIEFLAENASKFKYDEEGRITNLRREYLPRPYRETLIYDDSVTLEGMEYKYLTSLSIIEPTYKPYEKVETWMLGKRVFSKLDCMVHTITAITMFNSIKLDGLSGNYDLEMMFTNYTDCKDNSPFGEEVV